MSRCAIPAEAGVALVAVMLALGLVSAIVMGMAIIASSDPSIAANTESRAAAAYVADAGLAIVASELQGVSDWSAVLSGAVGSAVLPATSGTVRLSDGRILDLARQTNLLNCGRASGCSDGQLDLSTADRPWGRNNPRWRIYGHASTRDLWPTEPDAAPFHLVVWVGDDPAESDNQPTIDEWSEGEPPPPGSGIIWVRTASFGSRGAHAARTGTILRVTGGSHVRIANRSSGR